GEVAMRADDRFRVIEDHLAALEVEGRAQHELGLRARREAPGTHGRAAEGLSVAARNGDASEPVDETPALAPSRLAERLALSGVQRDGERVAPGQEALAEVRHGPPSAARARAGSAGRGRCASRPAPRAPR